MCEWHLANEDATTELAQRLVATRPIPACLYLSGPIGAGKSTLARAMLRALGVDGAIRSPTYTLVERYPIATQAEAWHLDLYRIAMPNELECLGLDEECVALWLIEWPERGAAMLPAADLWFRLSVEQNGRRLHVSAATRSGDAWLARLRTDQRLQTLGIVAADT